VTGKFNWYARAVDGTMLTPISALTAQQAKPTQATMKKVQHFLDYAATQEPAVTTYRASDMVLAIHSDAGYLNEEGISYQKMCPTHQTTVPSTTKHPSSKQSCRQLPKQKLDLSTQMHKRG
jgi:hypothetical protein